MFDFIDCIIMNDIIDKDKLIASLQNQVRGLSSKCSALEQENALLNNELEHLKKQPKKKVN